MKTLLALAADIAHQAALANLVARDTAPPDVQHTARALLALALDLEREVEAAQADHNPADLNRS